MNWRQVIGFRMKRHQLDERAPAGEMLEIAGRLCGLHAQLMSSAELSLWARTRDLPREAVRQALWKEGSLIKTWAMRGTLHLLPAGEYPLWQAALGTYRHFLKPGWLRAFGVTVEDHARLAEAIGQALEGRALTRAELAAEVFRRTGAKRLRELVLQSWGSMLKPAAYQGRLCFAESQGQNVRFMRPDRWLRRRAQPEQALRELTRRYLAAHGPATREDFGRWWGVGSARAKDLLIASGAKQSDGYWLLPEDIPALQRSQPPRNVRLLPAFDPYVIAASLHAERLMPGAFRARIYRSQGWISPVLLVAGTMAGVWRAERKGRSLEVRIEPFAPLPAWARKAALDESGDLARFFGGALRVQVAGAG